MTCIGYLVRMVFAKNVDRFANVPIKFSFGLLLDRSFAQLAENESSALFGQLTKAITDDVNVTIGGRQTWDDKTMDQSYNSSPTDGRL